MSTYFGHETLLPTAFQPISLSIRIAIKRSMGVISGVENTVVRIVIDSDYTSASIAVPLDIG